MKQSVCRAWKVYGLEGHRQRGSFSPSYVTRTNDGVTVAFFCEDINKTNEYVTVVVWAPTAKACESELFSQISDGHFENCRVGGTEEITEGGDE